MAKPNYQFEKRQRDLAKKRKQEEKRQHKLAAKAAASEGGNAAVEDEAGETVNPEGGDTPAA